mgnify:FL=1
MSYILEIDNLYKSYWIAKEKGFHDVLKGINLQIKKGEIVGLVGESGCGKSTIAKVIFGLTPADAGKVKIDGEVADYRYPKKLFKKIQMIFQMPKDSFNPKLTIGKTLIEVQRNFNPKLSRQEAAAKAEEYLTMMELPVEYMSKYPMQLSGGECQRVAIARALLTEPDVLICDEMTSSLDVSVQAEIMNKLLELKEEKGFSVLFITHDLVLAGSMCDRIVVMNQGEFIEEGSAYDILNNPKNEYTQNIINSIFV